MAYASIDNLTEVSPGIYISDGSSGSINYEIDAATTVGSNETGVTFSVDNITDYTFSIESSLANEWLYLDYEDPETAHNLNELSNDQAIILEKDTFDNYKDKKVYFFGDGSDKFKKIVSRKNFIFLDNINPDSKFMGKLSYDKFINRNFEDLSSFEPNYIKDFYLIKKKGKWQRS